MKSFNISSFKYGLDTRKDVLSSVAGTLVACENCYINQGGEIEKRKAFVLFADVAILDGNGDAGTFGIESTSVGILVFGSALTFGTTPTQSQPVLASAIPTGVTYQQLKHPTLVNDSSESYDRTLHRMTQLVFSENYNGKAFACAKFADGRKFLYYDGNLIQHSANGLVMTNRTALADLSVDLARQIEAFGWNASANLDESLAAQTGSTLVESPPSDFFNATIEKSSTAGYLGNLQVAQNSNGTAAVKAVAGFQITGNSGTFQLQAPITIDTTTPLIDLCGAPVAALGTAILTAAAIAKAVNDLTSVHGYTAQTNTLDSVFIYAPENFDINVGIDLTVNVTTGTVGAAGASPTSLSVAVTPNPGYASKTVNIPGQSIPTFVILPVTAIVVGGTGPYTYSWEPSFTGSGNGIFFSASGNSATATLRLNFNPSFGQEGMATGTFKVTVTDSAGTPASAVGYFIVTLELINLANPN